MDLLLDTHTFLWFAQRNSQLSPKALTHLMDGRNTRYLSAASIWEMAIKVSNQASPGQFALNQPLGAFLSSQLTHCKVVLLPIDVVHVDTLSTLPFPTRHKDPFDRLIIAQSLSLAIPVVGIDDAFDHYGITRIW